LLGAVVATCGRVSLSRVSGADGPLGVVDAGVSAIKRDLAEDMVGDGTMNG